MRYCEPTCRHAESDGCVEQAHASFVIKGVPYEIEEYARAQNTRSRRAETKRLRKYRAAVRGREETYGRLWPAISRSMDEISLTLHLSSHKQSTSYDRGVGTIQQFLIFIRGTPFSPKIPRRDAVLYLRERWLEYKQSSRCPCKLVYAQNVFNMNIYTKGKLDRASGIAYSPSLSSSMASPFVSLASFCSSVSAVSLVSPSACSPFSSAASSASAPSSPSFAPLLPMTVALILHAKQPRPTRPFNSSSQRSVAKNPQSAIRTQYPPK